MADRIDTPVLDMTAGSRMMWFDKHNQLATFVDKRHVHEELPTGHVIDVNPDVLADWTLGLPFEDETYNLVLFDPPHLIHAGDNSWLAKKYGTLDSDNWQEIIKLGFDEGMRVLKENGTLVFKWNDSQIPLPDILDVIGQQPLFGQKSQKTHWLVFMKA
ncbi:SAM-dependent methyltransferase [Leuconostoc gasicomitatum]|uniref:SAM-dependent methyltransferase n=1 Tax=Leuconostoc gasicomitatum TaxID=115778 RepID=UPI0007E0185E|nr:SAM-dependent methyltransferase [Leuconostoc gasicomitatum]CUW06684.1 putative methyltransferase [Leuconostoc gasicomitatum]